MALSGCPDAFLHPYYQANVEQTTTCSQRGLMESGYTAKHVSLNPDSYNFVTPSRLSLGIKWWNQSRHPWRIYLCRKNFLKHYQSHIEMFKKSPVALSKCRQRWEVEVPDIDGEVMWDWPFKHLVLARDKLILNFYTESISLLSD